METNPPLRRLSSDERRAQLLRVALDLFAEHGYHATRFSQIIERADVARGTFYQYFDGKKEIFDQLLEQLLEQMTARVIPISTADPSQIAAAVRANVEALCRTAQENLPMARVLLEQAVGLSDAGRDQLRAFYKRVLDRLELAVATGQALGIIRGGDPAIISVCLLGMVKESLYQQIIGTRSFSVEKVVDEILVSIERGMLSPSR